MPVVAGAGTPYGTHRKIWTTGTEGRMLLPEKEIEALQQAPEQKHRAAKWILEQVNKYRGEVVILALGE